MEEDLRLATRGADHAWLEDAHAEDNTQEAHGLELPAEALERLALMKQMEREGGLLASTTSAITCARTSRRGSSTIASGTRTPPLFS
eukprot:15791201-Heterocapsa_arctica.AAC.1